MIDLAQADPTLRFTPRGETETDHIHASNIQRAAELREMSDEVYWAFIRGQIQ